MKDMDATICEIMEISEKLYDLSAAPHHNAKMRSLTNRLEKALAKQNRLMKKHAELGV
jgi:hypothetical protein